MPSISVIIPCYNSELYVGRAIESVLNQSFRDFEIILVDNNSVDATATIIQKYVEANPGLINFVQEPRIGAPFARNRGLSAARGEWLQFLDSDDEILPNKLKHQFELTKTDASIGVVVGSFYEVRVNQDVISKKVVHLSSDNPWKALVKSGLGKTSSTLWKKDSVLTAGGWNENLTSSQEYDLLFRILQNNIKIEYHYFPETIHHVVNNSISRSDNDERTIEILNNYINLRISIRNYLKLNGKYSREIANAYSTSIYFKLLPYTKRIPDYVKMKQEEIRLKVPIQYIVMHKLRKFKNKVRTFLKPIFYNNLKKLARFGRV